MNSSKHYKTLNKCNQTPNWGDNWLPFRFFFGEGWTIATINRGIVGREIHVMSSVPLRRKAIEIMNSFNCDWITTIDENNIKAHNLAIKCGFEVVKSISVNCLSTGESFNQNLYKRCKKWQS